MRNFLLPAICFSPMVSYGLILIGLIFNVTGLIYLGIFFFGLVLFCHHVAGGDRCQPASHEAAERCRECAVTADE